MAKAFMDGYVDIVDRSLRGFAKAHHGLVELHTDPLFVLARDRHPGRRVGLVSGGGSGHEPMHVGLVGQGMLDAAVPGRVFASPHNRQIYQASRAAAGEAGILHIVKNYTGDRINFGIAAERLKADGIHVARVLVDDDLATDDPEAGTGRRGTAATIVVEKLLGAAADEGLGLEQLEATGRRVVAHSRSIAVASARKRRCPPVDPPSISPTRGSNTAWASMENAPARRWLGPSSNRSSAGWFRRSSRRVRPAIRSSSS